AVVRVAPRGAPGVARARPPGAAGGGAGGGARAPLVAVDLPSGVETDSGRVLWPRGHAPVPAARTLTFEAMKRGHVLGAGAELSGPVEVIDLGLAPERAALRDAAGADWAYLVTAAGLDTEGLSKRIGQHKYSHGAALVFAGGPGRGGAARLAARAALRVGAGLVTLVCPPEALSENAARLDAVMLRAPRNEGGLRALLADARLGALAAGPGLGLVRARRLVPLLLARGLPLVLDADALSAFAAEPGRLFARLHRNVVLTPHGGEFARLFPDIAARAGQGALSAIEAAQEAAGRCGAVVLLKGAASVIAAPGRPAQVVALTGGDAAPWLATAGSGDVLTGLVAGLMARGMAPEAAAATGAWLHGAAARAVGPGLIAEDLPEALPDVLASLLSA
ncbi:MAG: NAD(P)H-hydrate dehydratase, partial [Rhodobacteraceae bacterium]|nr:NAD(P)H-hydrate dehydratase [Paracoccaceae bacterium]